MAERARDGGDGPCALRRAGVAARLRPTVAAVGGAFAIAVSYAILTLGWHFPSDVLGGFLVATMWTLVAIAVIAWSDLRWPVRRLESRLRPVDAVGPVLVAACAVLLAIAIAVGRPASVATYAAEHTTFVAGAAAIAAVAAVLAAALARGLIARG